MKKEVPELVKSKIKELNTKNVKCTRIDNETIEIEISNHAVYQYLRHRSGRGRRIYDPLSDYKKKLKEVLLYSLNEDDAILIKKGYECPIIFDIKVYNNPYKSTESQKRLLYKLTDKIKFTKTPDIDNYQKTVMDVMNKNFWNDDAQIIEIHAYKFYSSEFKDKTIIKIKYLLDKNPNIANGSLDKAEKIFL